MLMQKEREWIVYYGKLLIDTGLTRATGGNISVFDPESQLVALSPSGIRYHDITVEDVTVITLDGTQIEGDGKPSSESAMHRIFYQQRPGICSVVHTHSVFGTTLATLGWSLPPANYLLALAGGEVRCADYAAYGTDALAELALRAMENRKACLLKNHGLLAVGATLQEAFSIAENVEHCAEYYYRAKCVGEPVILSDEQMAEILEKISTYGQ